jgi:hypothetical protein
MGPADAAIGSAADGTLGLPCSLQPASLKVMSSGMFTVMFTLGVLWCEIV